MVDVDQFADVFGADRCPDNGYVSGCSVYDARQVQPDNKVDFARAGSSFSKMLDADTSKLPFAISGSGGSPHDTFITSGTDSAGHPQTITLQALSTGGSLLTIRTERTDEQGQTYVDHQIIQLSAVGSVASASDANATSQGSYVDPVTGVYVIQDAATGTGTGTGSGTQPIVFPSDYARVGEAATAAG